MVLLLKSAISSWPNMQIIILSRILKETGQPKRKSGRGLKESDQDSKHNNICLCSCCLSLRFLQESVFQVYQNPRKKQNRQRMWHRETEQANYLWWPMELIDCGMWPRLALKEAKIFPGKSPWFYFFFHWLSSARSWATAWWCHGTGPYGDFLGQTPSL